MFRLLSVDATMWPYGPVVAVYERSEVELDSAIRDAVLANILVTEESAYTFRRAGV